MARPRKIAAKVTDVKKLRTYRTRTEETQEEVKSDTDSLIENPVGLEHAVNDLIETHGYSRKDARAIAGNFGKGIQKKKNASEVKEAKITPEPSPKGHMETVVQEEYYNACKQNLQLGGQRFVPGAIIPKDFLTEDSIKFYLQGGHIASRKKLRTVRKLN